MSGKDRLVEFQSRKTIFIDCKGRTLLPGFIDPHFHFHAFAASLVSIDLSSKEGVRSIKDIQSKIKACRLQSRPGSWIRAQKYCEFDLKEKRHPNRWDIDQAVCDFPVKLTHRSGHAHVLNSLGLTLAGISRSTPDPPGGMIDRDLHTGDPTGLLYEMGGYLSKCIPRPEADQFEHAVKMAGNELIASGITSFQDASIGNGTDEWHAFHNWIQKKLIQHHVTMMLGADTFDIHGRDIFFGLTAGPRLQLGGVKIILDETTGSLHPEQRQLNEKVLEIHRAGQQVAIHAIEANAVESACLAIEHALKRFPRTDHRHRIEHCSVCPSQLAGRLASAGIWVVTQPSFVYFNGKRYLETVPRQQHAFLYPIKSLLDKGISVAAGSDAPVAPLDPFAGIYSAVTRCCETGERIGENNAISVMDALAMMTIKAAMACRHEMVKGSISPGKRADMILVDQDPTKVDLEDLKTLKVQKTILGGEFFDTCL
ncbi:amidohydrolase [Desulfotignum balticum]|uniref:amidohydrolase n=1 Tax=Desulfotignum balticum TaxID=115781 RepID=UPI00146D9F24|nr:amidohydrolase [Desulfotignum balticum]